MFKVDIFKLRQIIYSTVVNEYVYLQTGIRIDNLIIDIPHACNGTSLP